MRLVIAQSTEDAGDDAVSAVAAVTAKRAEPPRLRPVVVARHRTPSLVVAHESPGLDWDKFVNARPHASKYLLSGWTELVRDVFGHQSYFVEARGPSGELRGVLPLVRQKSVLFGGTLTSGAFFNYGGALADHEEDVQCMMECARRLAARTACRYVEFRDVERRSGSWDVRTDKASLILSLPREFATLSKQLGSKLRSQVKRAERDGATTKVGGRELLDDFYGVFCEGMHRLGTPVYPRRFFAAILERFSSECTIVIVERAGRPSAAAFMVVMNGTAEVPWAACRQDAKPSGFNMKLYWESLRTAVELGCHTFDFGRSTIGGGTYKFKLQWGAEPRQLYWHRWQRNGSDSADALSRGPTHSFMNVAVTVWKRLPPLVANTLGPLVSPSLPW